MEKSSINRQVYRDAMAKLCAAVNIITTDGEAGLGGFTASAVCSVTDDPPTLLVCMNRSSSQIQAFRRNGVICINVLAGGHQEISAVFAGRGGLSIPDRFAQVAYVSGMTGSPVVEEAVVSFDCIIKQVVEVGTHDVIFCEVEAIYSGTGRSALVYFNRDYHHV